ncbi:hypothetical protein [Tautonia marina]|uniref:hypothetical protein n=1 Tax=Tautonia marina TaxID=2653855 RepID=UPI0012610D97|nr:hypothetical protein [Tautonia marina]
MSGSVSKSSADGPSTPARTAFYVVCMIASTFVALFVLPYHDIFAGQPYQPPDILKPLVFRLMAATVMGFGVTFCFSK